MAALVAEAKKAIANVRGKFETLGDERAQVYALLARKFGSSLSRPLDRADVNRLIYDVKKEALDAYVEATRTPPPPSSPTHQMPLPTVPVIEAAGTSSRPFSHAERDLIIKSLVLNKVDDPNAVADLIIKVMSI